ncbi:MAG TPA: hypothetical protein VNA88_12965 [Candidatus Kapabacteria bacterium]|nr:hypothetical protein [Candidatus Kapabacteria bacterium]
MEDLRIESREALSEWLASHHGFPDLFVLRMEPRPQPDGVPLLPVVRLELATQIDGGFEAGEKRTLRVFELTGEDAETFWMENPRGYDATFCNDQGMLQLDLDRPGLQLEVPSRVQLVCRAITVRELADRTEIIQPWIDDAELSAQVRGYGLPSPADWVELFAQEGVSVVWRRFGEGPQTADAVPADYTGWYLQEPERFARAGGNGLFFFSSSARPGAFVVHVQNHDPDNHDLWKALQQILLHYPDLEIRTGNCRLDAATWRSYLKDGYIT